MKHCERVTIEILTNTPAFNDNPASEIASVLEALAKKLREEGSARWLYDSNNRLCGSYEVTAKV